MLNNIFCAGLGGQGVLTLGMLLAEMAASEGLFVTWTPEYGGEMRGGSANVKVKISDEELISPFMDEIDILVTLDKKPLAESIAKVEPGGVVLYENSLVTELPDRKDVRYVGVPATAIAERLGNPKGMSVAIVGAIIALTDMFPLDIATSAVEYYFSHKGLPVDKNKAVFIEGYNELKKNL